MSLTTDEPTNHWLGSTIWKVALYSVVKPSVRNHSSPLVPVHWPNMWWADSKGAANQSASKVQHRQTKTTNKNGVHFKTSSAPSARVINWVRGSNAFPTTKSWRANIFPVQTEQMRNIYYMANNFQIWKKLQANFIEPINTQYARTFTSKYT